jgi:hypothetical protein
MPTTTVTPITLNELTTVALNGTGVFDVLMRATRAHLQEEFERGRIKGSEYATVYLGSVQQVMQTSLEFLLRKEKQNLESELLMQQIEVAKAEVEIARQNALKIPKEIEILVAQKAQIVAQTALTEQQRLNAVTENTVLVAQECKLKAEFDVLKSTDLKTQQETSLLTQKTATERSQTQAIGVDENSVVGRQKALYVAQTNGFARDAENKVAKLMIDTWNVRRTTDQGTIADTTNKLDDATVGRAVTKMLAGVNA